MDLSASTWIEQPPEAVFAYVIDIPHDAEWRTGVVEAALTSDGPIGVGSTGFARAESGNRSVTANWRATEYRPERLVRWELIDGPFVGSGGYRCDPADGGTLFTLESDVGPTGFYRVLGPIFRVMGRRQNQRDVLKLKAILEQQSL